MIDHDAFDQEDEGYFASMTDIMVGMLFIFIIIIMFFALQINDVDADAVPKPVYDTVEAERDAALSQVAELEASVRTLQRELADALANLNQLTADIETKNETILTLEEEIASLREEIASLTEALELSLVERDAAMREVTELTNTLRALQEELADALNGLRELAAQIADKDDTIVTLEREIADLREEIARLTEALSLSQADQLSLYLAAADAKRTEILRNIKEAMRRVGIDVEIVEEQGVVRLPNDLLFRSGSFTIENQRASDAVTELGNALSRALPCFTRGSASSPQVDCNPDGAFIEAVFVEGHTDSVPVRGALAAAVTDNLGLSARRAETTYRRLLVEAPVLSSFLSVDEEPVLNVAAYGQTRPIRGNEDRSRNRRIDLRILMHTPGRILWRGSKLWWHASHEPPSRRAG